jgi:hypothetical protein
MSLNIGIIGLPNVGKSTTFNALTRAQHAEVASYPFTTIEPNRAIVPVPDPRLDHLAQLAGRQKIIHATIEFVDIAGLVAGASRGEGLGNKFLAQIRDVDAVLHVVRCFEDENVAHVAGQLDPPTDIATIETELALADLEQLDRRLDKLESELKADRGLLPTQQVAQNLRAHLDNGQPVRTFPERDEPALANLRRELRFLTDKPVIFLANVGEESLPEGNECVEAVRRHAKAHAAEAVMLCAELEMALAGLDDGERAEMLALAGLERSGLDQVIAHGYRLLGLISFFTMNEEEVRAWTIPQGTLAPQAAGRVHTDFERGFIKAEVVPYPAFVEAGSLAAARSAGSLRIEGKEYEVQDGELILFRFNV